MRTTRSQSQSPFTLNSLLILNENTNFGFGSGEGIRRHHKPSQPIGSIAQQCTHRRTHQLQGHTDILSTNFIFFASFSATNKSVKFAINSQLDFSGQWELKSNINSLNRTLNAITRYVLCSAAVRPCNDGEVYRNCSETEWTKYQINITYITVSSDISKKQTHCSQVLHLFDKKGISLSVQ